jgi:dTDP-4-dehydrorhamnose 3,5-epimerase-like enzyme
MPGVGSIPGTRIHEPFVTVLSDCAPKILHIPAGYANGFKTLEEGTIVQFFSTSTLEEALNDDIRYNYNKPNIWDEEYR